MLMFSDCIARIYTVIIKELLNSRSNIVFCVALPSLTHCKTQLDNDPNYKEIRIITRRCI